MRLTGGHPRVRGLLLPAALAAALWASPAASARQAPADGILSPRLATLARPAVAALPPAGQAAAVGLPVEGAGSLQRRGARVLVEVHFGVGLLARRPALRAAGAQILDASRRYQTATVAVRPEDLRALDGVPGAQAASESPAPQVAAACPSGPFVSQGDSQLRASQARTDFGLDGSGVTVGVISDSFATASGVATSAAGDVADGDLPGSGNPCGDQTPVDVIADYASHNSLEPESTDEGRAMAQVIHDLAPGAAIDFATAFGGELLLAQRIRQLATAGADVIVDDVSYPGEPFFQDGPVAVAAAEAEAEGIPYFSAAGNDNLEDELHREIGSWETPAFRDTGKCPAKLEPEATDCLDFNPNPVQTDDTFGITVEPESTLTVDLQWAEPRFGVHTDLDAYLLEKATGKPLEAIDGGGTGDNITEEQASELVSWENKDSSPAEVELAVNHCSGACNPKASAAIDPPVKLILAENGEGVEEIEYPQSSGGDIVGPAVFGHAGSPNVIAVGAVPYFNSGTAERFSSRGPVTHYFGPVTSTAPAAETAAQTIAKPDIAASDCVSTSFFFAIEGVSGFHFCGTSAAAPHAAAVAALARQANPGASPARILSGLSATARAVGTEPREAVGAGLIDAYGAIDEIALPPTISFPGDATLTKVRRPSLAFAANRPVTFSCALDGSALGACSSPLTPEAPLADGRHVLTVEALDLSGRTGRAEFGFTVDTRPPNTSFSAHPQRNLRTRRARVVLRFRFHSNSPGSRFVCRVDDGLFHFCPEVLSRRFAPGLHTVRVKAVDPAGNVDRSPAVFRFRVRRVGGRR
jgi:Subtilase family